MNFHLLLSSSAFTFALLSPAVHAELDSNNCELDPTVLGDPSLDRFNYSAEMAIDDADCTYSAQFKFTHDESLPIPDNPAVQCDPANQPPELASDGLPYYAGRWFYEELPKEMKEATGVDHLSLDFNPCGHPPADLFTRTHYDAHFYLVDTSARLCMTCDLLPGAPVCDFTQEQSTVNGKKFFNVGTNINGGGLANMPEDFEVGPGDMVPHMGGHAWNWSTEPADVNAWTEPIFVHGTYDSKMIIFEPMFPLESVTGDQDTNWTLDLNYVGQTVKTLPTKMSVSYEASTKIATIQFEGKSGKACKSPKATKSPKAPKSPKSPK